MCKLQTQQKYFQCHRQHNQSKIEGKSSFGYIKVMCNEREKKGNSFIVFKIIWRELNSYFY